MTVTEIKQALGQWNIRLRPDTPQEILDNLPYFSLVAVAPGRLNPVQTGDNLLSSARYVGVLRGRADGDGTELFGCGMAFWLGDEEDKGDVFVNPVTVASASFADAIRAVLPPSGSILEGTLHAIPGSGTFSSTFQYQTSRKAVTYVTDTYSTDTYPVSWRVNGDGTLDAGRDVDLFVTDPTTILVRKDGGRDMFTRGYQGSLGLGLDVEDYTTKVVLLAEGEGAATVTASASQATPFLDRYGNDLVLVRLISESETSSGNAQARATLQLNRFRNARPEVELSTADYDVSGGLAVGDVVAVFDPAAGFVDLDREMFWRGQPINPVALKVTELTWPVPAGWTVALRSSLDGTWLDLSDWYVPEGGSTTIKVGDLSRALTGIGGEPVGTRPVADTSTPAAPAFTSVESAAYQSQQSNDTRAAVNLQWAEPLNQDGSTVLDGDHYEIRLRATETFSYPVTWTRARQETWNELGTWNRLLSDPDAETGGWKTYFVGWDTTVLVVTELMVSAEYEIQIRAVDAATPPNKSPWSASTFHTTRTDTIAPAQPAPPVVASSRIAIQVIHRLGAASGGEFNLAQDLHHLEVHAGGPAFYPTVDTALGTISATENHLTGRIPVLASFGLETTEDVWVRVVAVDRFGNRSSASEAVQASVLLIDSAHISDLTASKITAGEILADLVMAARITTALTGTRVEVNSSGVILYDANGQPVINISAAASGNFFQITDGTDSALASIDSDGNGSFQEITADDVIIAGDSFLDDYYEPLPKGIVARGEYPKGSTAISTTLGVTKGAFELSFVAEAGRFYRVSFVAQIDSDASGTPTEQMSFFLYDGGESTPTLASTELFRHEFYGPGGTGSGFNTGVLIYSNEFTAGLHRLLIGFQARYGNGSLQFGNLPAVFIVEDIGSSALIEDTLVLNEGGGTAPPPVTNYVRTYSATWFQTYRGSLSQKTDTTANQGQLDSGSDGNQRSLVGFDYAAIRADLAGATITKVQFTAYAEHWWYNSGGTAVVGTHNYTSKPTTWADSRVVQDRQRQSSWPRAAKRTLVLSNTIGNELRDGSTTGIAFGPGPSSDVLYYGKFSGSGSNRPTLTISYTK